MTKNKKQKYLLFIEKNIIDCDISYRGGVLKIDVSELFPNIDNAVMGASQNYLGGGMAGSITGGSMFSPDTLTKKQQIIFSELKEVLKEYFYSLNNGGGDDYMQENITGKNAKNGFERLQNMPNSGY